MKNLGLLLLIATSMSAFAADAAIKGHLVDINCSSDFGDRPGWAAKHSKKCLQMLPCEKSGYGVLTEDRKIIKFDDDGNQKAKKFIADLTKNNDVKVTVTGSVDGSASTMTVSKIELQ
ncbi:MAG TPA: hypothetical protein VKZ53_11080 [Candidatus Angelobacter sp.]|nr:hypothetical protein [Candidatus Angelobacter sp.]